MRQISAAQERGAEAYCCTPHEPSDEHAPAAGQAAAGQAAAGQARWRAIRAPLARSLPTILDKPEMAKPTRDETPEITPQVIHLIDLLKWVQEGRLRVPRFQRELVWRRQDILDLFDSIANQYPIGTLFFWGADPLPASRDHLGPLKLPDYSGTRWLVLDGQQRLTTLAGVLLREESEWDAGLDPEDPGRWDLFFDARPDEGGFTHLAPAEAPPPSYIPVPALLDTMRLFRRVQQMMEGAPSAEQAESWVAKAQQVARAIQGYRVPIVLFTANNLSVAVESFSRLNRRGRTIGQDEMFSALTYTEQGGQQFHLGSEIDSLQREMKRSDFGEIDRTILLRAVLTAADLDIYRTDWTQLSLRVKNAVREKLPEAIEGARLGLSRAREFLRGIGILNTRMLPYSMQIVALSAFFGGRDSATDEQKALLVRWFWVSSFSGWFGSISPARTRRLVAEMKALAERPSSAEITAMSLDQEALPIPSRFDLRSARVRTLISLQLLDPPQQPDGTPLSAEAAARHLLARGPEAMSTICATVEDPALRSSPANRILDVAPKVRGQAKNWLLALDSSVRESVLASHMISPEAFEDLEAGRHDSFVERRLEVLAQFERDFMSEVGVIPPKTEGPLPSPIDVDDELPLEEAVPG